MSHELSVLENGFVEAMYTNKPAWMNMGQIFDPTGTTAPDSSQAGLLSGLDRWTVTIFAKNLLDDHTIIQQPTVNSVVEGYTVTPRTVGAALRRDF